MKLPFAEEDVDSLLEDNDFECLIGMSVVGEHLRTKSSGLADNEATKSRYDVFLNSVIFTFDYNKHRDRINQFQDIIDEINENPQSLLDKFYEAFRITFKSYFNQERADAITNEIEKIKAEREQQQSLTESRKKIIRENLLRLLRRNKGKK